MQVISTVISPATLSLSAPITWSSTHTLTLQANSTNNTGSGYGSITIQTNGSQPIISATGGGSLSLLASAGNIILDGGITLTGGTAAQGILTLSAQNVAGSITPASAITDIGGAINVTNFILQQGQWNQVASSAATLAAFSATNNFQLNSGAAFLRAVLPAGGIGAPGSTTNPYQLTDIYGLQGIGSTTSLASLDYILDNSIDGTATATWNSGAGFVPIPLNGGYINGGGFTVSNLTINQPNSNNIGFVSSANHNAANDPTVNTGINGDIFNLTLNNLHVTGSAGVGGFLGNGSLWLDDVNITGTSSVTGIFSSATLTGNGVGGLAGIFSGELNVLPGDTSSTTASVTGTGQVGGVIGELEAGATLQGTIFATSTANVLGTEYVGAFVGNLMQPRLMALEILFMAMVSYHQLEPP